MPQHTWALRTTGRGTHNITATIEQLIKEDNIEHGLCHIFCQHTSCGLILCEQTDDDVCADLENFLAKTAPDGLQYRHSTEGPDDMPAHIRSVLCGVETTIPIRHHSLALGTWQGIFVYEHRLQPQQRRGLVTTWKTP